MNKNTSKLMGDEKGISLIMTFFIMIILLSVVLSISVLLYSEIKIMRNMGNSVVSFYAADSGIEKVLYYDRQVRLLSTTTPCNLESPCAVSGQICGDDDFCATLLPRGLCFMFDSTNNPNYCADESSNSGIYCNSQDRIDKSSDGTGCDIDKCNNCQIYFTTTFDDRTYYTTAVVSPYGESSNFEIDSKGVFGSAQRQIQILITPPQ